MDLVSSASANPKGCVLRVVTVQHIHLFVQHQIQSNTRNEKQNEENTFLLLLPNRLHNTQGKKRYKWEGGMQPRTRIHSSPSKPQIQSHAIAFVCKGWGQSMSKGKLHGIQGKTKGRITLSCSHRMAGCTTSSWLSGRGKPWFHINRIVKGCLHRANRYNTSSCVAIIIALISLTSVHALGRQDFACMRLAHDELESVVSLLSLLALSPLASLLFSIIVI